MTRAKATSELLSAFHALLRTGDEAQLPDLLLEKNVRLRPYMGALKPALDQPAPCDAYEPPRDMRPPD